MANNDYNNFKITLPRGVAVFPRLLRPDTKYHDLGTYTVKVKVARADAAAIIETLSSVHESVFGRKMNKKNNCFFKTVEDDEGNDTGFILFACNTKNRKTKDGDVWDRRPAQFDSKANPIKTPVDVWGGSEISVACSLFVNKYGDKITATLQPVAVQIHKLVTGTGSDPTAATFGFGGSSTDDDDGFVAGSNDDDFGFSSGGTDDDDNYGGGYDSNADF